MAGRAAWSDGWRGKRFANIDFQRGQDLLLFLDKFLEFLGFLLGVGWPLCAVEVVFEARCEGHESRLFLRSVKRGEQKEKG